MLKLIPLVVLISISNAYGNTGNGSFNATCEDVAVQAALQEAGAPQRNPFISFSGCEEKPLRVSQLGEHFSVTLTCQFGAGFENPYASFDVVFVDIRNCERPYAVLMDWPKQAY